MSADPTLADVIREAVKAGVAVIHTSLPGTIVTYDSINQKASVKVALRPRVDDVDLDIQRPALEPLPVLTNIPVVWTSGLTFALTGGLVPGDPVTLVFQERSTDEWRANGNVENVPQDARRFDYADAVAIPGGRTFGATPSTGPLGSTAVDGAGFVVLSSTLGVRLGSTAGVQSVILGPILNAFLLAFTTGLSGATDPAVTGAAASLAASLVTGTHLSKKVFTE